jgi:hypothetical protein
MARRAVEHILLISGYFHTPTEKTSSTKIKDDIINALNKLEGNHIKKDIENIAFLDDHEEETCQKHRTDRYAQDGRKENFIPGKHVVPFTFLFQCLANEFKSCWNLII